MSLKILYLANYAPSEADNALVASEGVYPAYHRSMFELLVDFGFDVVPRRTPETLLDHEIGRASCRERV